LYNPDQNDVDDINNGTLMYVGDCLRVSRRGREKRKDIEG
jgi:hypothetical protein